MTNVIDLAERRKARHTIGTCAAVSAKIFAKAVPVADMDRLLRVHLMQEAFAEQELVGECNFEAARRRVDEMLQEARYDTHG